MTEVAPNKKATTNSGFLVSAIYVYFSFSIPSIFMMLPS